MLENSVGTKAPWMRDTAGIIFLFHSKTVEGNLKVTSTSEKALLRRMQCSRTIIIDLWKAPNITFKVRGTFVAQSILFPGDGTIYLRSFSRDRALYKAIQLELTVKEVGNLIVCFSVL